MPDAPSTAPIRPVPETDSILPVRDPPRPVAILVFVLAVAASVFHFWANTFGLVSDVIRNTAHFAFFGALCALVYPASKSLAKGRVALAADGVLAALTVAVAAYVILRERALSGRSFTSDLDYVAFGLAVLLAIEFARRVTGWIIPILIVIALTYMAWWGRYLSGPLGFGGLSIQSVLQKAIYSPDGLFGTIASISSTYVVMFILFGAFLVRSGAGEFIIGFSRAIAGRVTGGPGFVAVIASGLTGTISGSAVANTVSTGVITIPLMKRTGFPARFAAAVEATASTGGQVMPPIMGAGAFVMANLTEIDYFHIVAVAFLPALMYFLGVGFNVRVVAKKLDLTGRDEGAPSVWQTLREGGVAFLLPVVVLIGLLIWGFTPTFAAAIAILAVIVASWLTPRPMGPVAILEALALGAKNMILTGVLLIAIGGIVMVIVDAGVGPTFSNMITTWAGGSLILTIVLVAVASLILGMGLPVTAAYIVLATLSAPALYQLIIHGPLVAALAGQPAPEVFQAVFALYPPDLLVAAGNSVGAEMSLAQAQALIEGAQAGTPLTEAQAELLIALRAVPQISQVVGNLGAAVLPAPVLTTALLSAHMIIFWLSQDSNVTPPVCLTAFTAAAIAGTKPMRTGFTAWRIAKVLYIVPLLFAYTPFLSGEILPALEIFAFGTVGIYCLVAAMEGHAEGRVPVALRPLLAAVGVALLWPAQLWINVAGAAFFIVFIVWNVHTDRRTRAEQAPAT